MPISVEPVKLSLRTIGGDYRFGLNLLRAQYLANKQKHGDGQTKALGVGYQYDVSKRADLYSATTLS